MGIIEYALRKKLSGGGGAGAPGGTEGLVYTLSADGTYYICSGVGTATDTTIIIPVLHQGVLVKEIGAEAFEGNTTITHVIIPNSIRKIDYDAFSGCTALTNIAIPDSVTEISWYVFNECTALTNATIGRGVTNIGDYAFKGCINLKNITFANDGANLTYMGKGVFNGCRSLNTFNIPKGLTGLLFGTLSTNGGTKGGVTYQGIKELVIPANIKELADRAIYACSSLTSVTFEGIPDSIHSRLFETCAKLTDIYVPWTVGTFAEAESAWQAAGKTIHYKPSAEVEEAYKRRDLAYWFMTGIDQGYAPEYDEEGYDTGDYIPYGIKDVITVPPQVQDGSATSFNNLFRYIIMDVNDYYVDAVWAKEIRGVINAANVTSLDTLFINCKHTETIGDIINTSNVTSFNSMFASCNALTSIPMLDTRNATNMMNMFQSCTALTSIPMLDMRNVSHASNMFYYCKKLENLNIKNIKTSLQVGSGSSWGHKLTVDSLVNLCYELIDTGKIQYLTVGSVNFDKLTGVLVKQIEVTDEMRAEDEFVDSKRPFVVCDPMDEDGVILTDYIQHKNWAVR